MRQQAIEKLFKKHLEITFRHLQEGHWDDHTKLWNLSVKAEILLDRSSGEAASVIREVMNGGLDDW